MQAECKPQRLFYDGGMKLQMVCSYKVVAWLVGASLSFTAGVSALAAAPLAAQVLVEVDAPEKIDARWTERLCRLLPQPCVKEALQLYQTRGAAPSAEFTVTSITPLAMARVRHDAAGNWRLGNLFDFTGYTHSGLTDTASSSSEKSRLSLAPALYPLGPDRWAAAVLLTVNEMYSGGGAEFSQADFVALEEAHQPGPNSFTTPAHAGIPFSCSKMVRACFSEKEYKTSPHCHEETSGSLRITYRVVGKPADAYRWDYLWRQTEWPAHQRPSATKTTSTRFTDQSASANESTNASWCGGPQ